MSGFKHTFHMKAISASLLFSHSFESSETGGYFSQPNSSVISKSLELR